MFNGRRSRHLAVFAPASSGENFCVQKISPTKSLKTRPSSAHVALPYRPVASLMFVAEWLRCWGKKALAADVSCRQVPTNQALDIHGSGTVTEEESHFGDFIREVTSSHLTTSISGKHDILSGCSLILFADKSDTSLEVDSTSFVSCLWEFGPS